jgi:NAD(P)-dependent dehydrogenase (short-subunit alcohol dehydrogenase family)
VDLGLAGRRAIVTGASKGIGLAVTRRLIDEGAVVVGGSRGTTPELAALVDGGRVTAVPVDLATATGPDDLVAAALADGPVDILINNAGAVTPRTGGFLSVTDEDWWASLQLNLLSAVRTTRAVAPHMIDRERGSIVNTASVNATLPDPLVIDYGAAKAALANFSKALSKHLGPHGIRVNAVGPGPVSTGLWLGTGGVAATVSGAAGLTPDDVARTAVRDSATGRFTTAEEVADLIVFLAGDRAANITGVNYILDGGLTRTL